jgi:hypothetical protein
VVIDTGTFRAGIMGSEAGYWADADSTHGPHHRFQNCKQPDDEVVDPGPHHRFQNCKQPDDEVVDPEQSEQEAVNSEPSDCENQDDELERGDMAATCGGGHEAEVEHPETKSDNDGIDDRRIRSDPRVGRQTATKKLEKATARSIRVKDRIQFKKRCKYTHRKTGENSESHKNRCETDDAEVDEDKIAGVVWENRAAVLQGFSDFMQGILDIIWSNTDEPDMLEINTEANLWFAKMGEGVVTERLPSLRLVFTRCETVYTTITGSAWATKVVVEVPMGRGHRLKNANKAKEQTREDVFVHPKAAEFKLAREVRERRELFFRGRGFSKGSGRNGVRCMADAKPKKVTRRRLIKKTIYELFCTVRVPGCTWSL